MPSEPTAVSARLEAADALRRVAIEQFSEVGYAGASLGSIAEIAGYSKSAVLYHYSSKEALLEAALAPAIEQIDRLLGHSVNRAFSDEDREAFVEEFIDILITYRGEARIFLNQGKALSNFPSVQRANALIQQLCEALFEGLPTVAQRARFGMALGGAAFVLAGLDGVTEQTDPISELRPALVTIVTELLTPLAGQPGTSARPPARIQNDPKAQS